jgi:MoxR-like ATPase
MESWKIFKGTGNPHSGIQNLPDPPSWRLFENSDARQTRRGSTFLADPEMIETVNAALYLRRPLLITGKPGTGKTSLTYAVAHELQLGEVLYWPITSRTTLKDGLYSYDAIGRLQDAQQNQAGIDNLQDIGNYIQLGPLGTALLPSDQPRMLLIDEIDKSDIDLPNDLLYVFEEGRFGIPELIRISQKIDTVRVRTAYTWKERHENELTVSITGGYVQCQQFPFVILTSNGERDFPPPFLRRCLRLSMKEPNETELKQIVAAHLGKTVANEAEGLIHEFFTKRNETDGGSLATDQLLNAAYLLFREKGPWEDKDSLIAKLLKPLSSDED